MSNVAIINPAGISAGKAQEVSADLTKFDYAKEQVDLVLASLLPNYTIKSDEQAAIAMEALKTANDVSKALEEKRKQLVKPFNDGASGINEYKKKLVVDLDPGIAKVKQAILAWDKEKEKRAMEERIIARQGQLAELNFKYNSASDRYEREQVGSMMMSEIKDYSEPAWKAMIDAFADKIIAIAEAKAKVIENDDVLAAFGSDEQKKEAAEKIEEAKKETTIQVTHHVPSFGSTKTKGTTKRWTFETTDASLVPREYLIVDESAIRKAIAAGVREIPGVRIFQEQSLSIR